MIEIFKTNIASKKQAVQIMGELQKLHVGTKINFDLEDCDKILRVEGTKSASKKSIVNHLKKQGYNCEILS